MITTTTECNENKESGYGHVDCSPMKKRKKKTEKANWWGPPATSARTHKNSSFRLKFLGPHLIHEVQSAFTASFTFRASFPKFSTLYRPKILPSGLFPFLSNSFNFTSLLRFKSAFVSLSLSSSFSHCRLSESEVKYLAVFFFSLLLLSSSLFFLPMLLDL